MARADLAAGRGEATLCCLLGTHAWLAQHRTPAAVLAAFGLTGVDKGQWVDLAAALTVLLLQLHTAIGPYLDSNDAALVECAMQGCLHARETASSDEWCRAVAGAFGMVLRQADIIHAIRNGMCSYVYACARACARAYA